MFGTTFTAWTLFTDFGLISALLLIGKILRAKVKIIQQLFIPPSLIAGGLGLAFGPNGLGYIPLSSSISVYSAILIAMVFGSVPLGTAKSSLSEIKNRVGGLWAYAQNGMLMQWGIACLFGFFVLRWIWPDLHPGFGAMLPTGFYGGHGTAAAIGSAFNNNGWDEALSLGMTTATVGIISAILGGLILIKWAARKKYTEFISDFKDLPAELRTGLVPEEKRDTLGSATTSSISIETFTFHLALIFVVALGGYTFSLWIKGMYPRVDLPVFSCAFLVALILKQFMNLTKSSRYICPVCTNRLGSTFTDYLVAFGVASIKLSVVVKYAAPLAIMLVLGIVVVLFTALYLGYKMLKTYWFEKSIFCWGWWTGTMAMGIALLRIVDPKLQSKSLDDIATAYLPIAPVEIVLISLVPMAFTDGWGVWLSVACIVLTLLILWLSRLAGWWKKPQKKG